MEDQGNAPSPSDQTPYGDQSPPTRTMDPAVAAPVTIMPTDDEKTMAMLCHLLALFTSFVGPLVIWLMKKDTSRFVDAHGRAVLNFTISVFVYALGLVLLLLCSGLLGMITGGAGMLLACPIYLAALGLVIYSLVITIIRCVEASSGKFTPYPITINFLTPVDPYLDGTSRP